MYVCMYVHVPRIGSLLQIPDPVQRRRFCHQASAPVVTGSYFDMNDVSLSFHSKQTLHLLHVQRTTRCSDLHASVVCI